MVKKKSAAGAKKNTVAKKKPAKKKTPAKARQKIVKKKPVKPAEQKVEKIVHHPPAAVPPPPPPPEKKRILIDTPDIVIKDLAEKMGIKIGDLIKALMIKGVLATINQRIDVNLARTVIYEFDMEPDIKLKKEGEKEEKIPKAHEVEPSRMAHRSPVVTIMGHVDHGKTKLLDTIRQTNVIAKESGGITQHIGAYQAEVKGKKITFLDTPGHEAFTALRARGAKVTDIAILVVAADDGVMPQTVEAIDHARAAGVPIIVAINKIDKPDANLDRVKKQLSEHDLMPEEWGGKTVTCQISAKEARGIDELLEMILLMSDILELKADPHAPASGVVIESKLDKGRGPVATVLIKNGTLKVGNSFSIGSTYGRVRALVNDLGNTLKEAGPATPVEVLGCSEVPQPGDLLKVSDSDKQARSDATQRKDEIKQKSFAGARISLESFSKHMKEGEKSDLNLIIKADVQGSLEAIIGALTKLSVEDKKVRIIHGGAGNINESDVMLAEASQAIVIGFHVSYEGESKAVAEREGVDVKIYDVIYNVVDDVKLALEGMLEPEYEEVVVGNAEVRAVYKYSKIGTIAGCFVNHGRFTRGGMIRIKRNGEKVHEGRLESLKRFKEDVKSVEKGYECGIALMGYQNFRVGDQIETFEVRKKPRKKSAK